MNKAASRFAKGSAVYTCRSCGRSTRATGRGDNEHSRLCVECYELGGIDNAYNDNCASDGDLTYARSLLAACIAKGGKISAADFDYIPF